MSEQEPEQEPEQEQEQEPAPPPPPEQPAAPAPMPEHEQIARTLAVLRETAQTYDQAMRAQTERLDEIAKRHDLQAKAFLDGLAAMRDLMSETRQLLQSLDPLRDELISVTASLAKIATITAEALEEIQQAEADA